jgi:hypothetical protein
VKELERADLAAGFIQPIPNSRSLVRLQRRRGFRHIDLRVPSQRVGRALLQALGIDVSQAAVSFLARGPLFFFAFLPRTITVGVDGVMISWLFFPRFIPFGAIENAAIDGGTVSLTLRQGEVVKFDLKMMRLPDNIESNTLSARALFKRVTDARALFEERRSGVAAAELLARRGRASSDWLQGVRALTGDHAYRGVTISREDLWRIAEDPARDVEVRVGAAAALRGALDEAERLRLADLAKATVLPRVRIALDAAVSGEDEEMERALEELADDSSLDDVKA